ncbi:MAG: ABC transporter permease [Archangium sp.]|nr:ABC transporter permease [Archangium sp.]MDP3155751.1 ABC transporter permease [Archangium sp.]MDP3573993.1 ABC transporter permease [Archangium sp.]
MRKALPSILSVISAILICFIAAGLTRDFGTAVDAFMAMWWGAFGDWPKFLETGASTTLLRPLGEAATKAAILTFTGLSVTVAFRVGLFNIGAQGQLVVGALAAAVVGAKVELPALLHLPLCLLAAAAAGALYALGPAILKLKRGVHEVISTIMLNWVAVSLVDNWLVTGPLRATTSGDNSASGTDQIHASAELPRLLGDLSRLNFGIVLALIAAVLTWVFLTRFTRGFEWKAIGLSQDAARASGIDVERGFIEAMLLSGAFAGLGGAVLILGTELKYPASLGAPWGFDGIAMSLIGQGHPLGVLAISTLFGGLRAGGTRMQLFGVHKSFPELIQGLALLLVAARMLWDKLIDRLSPRKPA